MMRKTLATLATLALLAGCASAKTDEFDARVEESRARIAQASAESVKADAELVKAACDNGDAPCTAAVMSAFAKRQSLAQSQPVMQRRPGFAEQAFPWINLLKDLLIANRNADAQEHASDNNRDTQLGLYGAFKDMAGEIQAPAVPQANITQTLSGTGVLGDGSYSLTDRHDSQQSASTETSTATTTSTDRHDVNGSYNPVDYSQTGSNNPIDNSQQAVP